MSLTTGIFTPITVPTHKNHLPSLPGELYFATLVHYNTQRENLKINARFQWRYAPVSDFYLIYTDDYFTNKLSSKIPSTHFQTNLLAECVVCSKDYLYLLRHCLQNCYPSRWDLHRSSCIFPTLQSWKSDS